MIEAVNSVIANANVLRGSAEQASAARSYAANPERIQEVVQAPYVSPYIYMNVDYNKAVLQIRDSDTGDVLKQFPSEASLELRSRQGSQPEFEIPEGAEQAVTAGTAKPVKAEARVAAEALASTAAQAKAVSAPPTSGNVVVTA